MEPGQGEVMLSFPATRHPSAGRGVAPPPSLRGTFFLPCEAPQARAGGVSVHALARNVSAVVCPDFR